jgi:hypothetical protein
MSNWRVNYSLPGIYRIYAVKTSTWLLACGSKVLYDSLLLIFRPQGEK